MPTYHIPGKWRRREVRSDRDVTEVLDYVSNSAELSLQDVSYELLNVEIGEVLWRGPHHKYEVAKDEKRKATRNAKNGYSPDSLKLYIEIKPEQNPD